MHCIYIFCVYLSFCLCYVQSVFFLQTHCCCDEIISHSGINKAILSILSIYLVTFASFLWQTTMFSLGLNMPETFSRCVSTQPNKIRKRFFENIWMQNFYAFFLINVSRFFFISVLATDYIDCDCDCGPHQGPLNDTIRSSTYPYHGKIGSNLKKHKDPLRLWLCTRTEKLIKCQRKTLSSLQRGSRIPRGKSHVCRNNNNSWIIPPWRKISVKSVFIAEPWTNSNLIRGANLFRSQKCIGFNFTLHAFRYQQEGVKREGMRRETKRKTENIWSLIFCQKSPYQRELKSILLQTKEGARGK